ncbi:NAD(P)-dependent glycerol-3-phosphate dehydrogenase [Candidatus Babeliales bacterium]|nr:NAD(P)-dependent glycerol-3-phosphate dehydrogenase [Candidatus Babeliales bacterium]
MNKHITVLGAGAWGTAIAQLLATNGYNVLLWALEPEVARSIETTKINQTYLPGFSLHNNIRVTTDLTQAVAANDWIFEAIPVAFLRQTLERANDHVHDNARWVVLSKGIERDTLLLPSEIIQDVCGKKNSVAVLSGPTFAQELVAQNMSAAALACSDSAMLKELESMVANNFFKPYATTDTVGVQLGGSMKNVLALAVGIAQGHGCAANTTAYLLTVGLDEVSRLITHCGGNAETVYGLSGLGDIMLTCFGSLSKNLRAGTMLGKNRSLEALQKDFQTLPEGINTAQTINQLLVRESLTLPLFGWVYSYLFETALFEDLFSSLRSHQQL